MINKDSRTEPGRDSTRLLLVNKFLLPEQVRDRSLEGTVSPRKRKRKIRF